MYQPFTFTPRVAVFRFYINTTMLATFDLDGSIALLVGAKYLDLHNSFDFVGCEYRPPERFMQLRWNRGTGEWVSTELPKAEDNCVASIAFLPVALNDNFDAVTFGERFPDEHMSLTFQSGAGIKIWAESVQHEFV